MGLTKAQRFNRMMERTFRDYKERREKESKMSYNELIADGYSKETAQHIALENKLRKIAEGK